MPLPEKNDLRLRKSFFFARDLELSPRFAHCHNFQFDNG